MISGKRNTPHGKRRRLASAVRGMISLNKRRSLSLVFVVGLLAAFAANANRPGHDLESLVANADIIVLGKVDSVSKLPVVQSQGERIYSSTIAVEKCLKRTVGPFPQAAQRIKYMFLTGGPEDSAISSGKTYILFLKDSEIGPYPVDGPVGVLQIENGKAKTFPIQGEPAEQPLEALQSKIQRYSHGFGCDP